MSSITNVSGVLSVDRRMIYKYALKGTPGEIIKVEMPVGAQIISVQMQNGVPTAWAIVKGTQSQVEDREFVFVGTGWAVLEDEMILSAANFIATIQHDIFVWHLFEKVEFIHEVKG